MKRVKLGATPILVTSICRKLFEGTKISRLGRIDNGKAHGVDENNHTYDYPYHMKKVADSLKVECLDLTTACKEYMESWGPKVASSSSLQVVLPTPMNWAQESMPNWWHS